MLRQFSIRVASIFVATAATAFAAGATQAATTVTNSLTSAAGLSPDLVISDTVNNQPSFSAAGATFTNAGNNGRNYIRTTQTDFSTKNFTAFVTLDLTRPGARAFFGMGDGQVGTYGTPDWNVADTIWLELLPGASNEFTYRIGVGPNGPNGGAFSGPVTASIDRLEMSYDSTAKTITYALDQGYAGGPFVATFTSPAYDVSALTGNSRVYVGGESSVIASNLVVAVPEPASLTVFSLAGCLLLGRRRATQR